MGALLLPHSQHDPGGRSVRGREATLLRAEPTETAYELELCVATGVDRGARCLLASDHPGPFVVGKIPSCELCLQDHAVSRRHAAFDASSWPVRVSDMGSTNGTFVNGVSVVEALLVGGEVLNIGGETLLVECHPAEPRCHLSGRQRFGHVLGASSAMRRIYPVLERLAMSPIPVLVEGEPGTGKGILAESLHEMGPQSEGPFVVVGCMKDAMSLVLRERVRGSAFDSLFAQAAGGTILFEDIGDLDATMQRALTRALLLASARTQKPRLLATTRYRLERLVEQGRFREDLYALVSVARLHLPPLRARHGDAHFLARHFWDDGGGGPPDVLDASMRDAESYAWPGNVRELAEFVRRLLQSGEGAAGGPQTLACDRRESGTLAVDTTELLRGDIAYAEARRRLLVAFEHEYVERMLVAHDGNVTRAAAASGLARRNFQLIRARRSAQR